MAWLGGGGFPAYLARLRPAGYGAVFEEISSLARHSPKGDGGRSYDWDREPGGWNRPV
jgi:hypothetical protein